MPSEPTDMNKKYLIVIGGPTASGKTAVAIDVAKHFGTEIISADSRQFYREMNIGTAKPSPAELATVPHHFINSQSIENEYTVGDFEREALQLLNRLFEKHDHVVMAGGSGLFIQAVCEGLDEFPPVPDEVKNHLEEEFRLRGLPFLQEELKAKDPFYFEEVDRQNPQRLLRALGVCRASGRPYSDFRTGHKATRHFTPVYILLASERQTLYTRINDRVDTMMANGLLEEANSLFPQRHKKALQTVGYQELFDYFERNTTLDEAVALVKQNSRRYAKRQLTWFRKHGDWRSFQPDQLTDILAFINA